MFPHATGTYVGLLSYIKKTFNQEHLSNNIWEKESLILSFLTTLIRLLQSSCSSSISVQELLPHPPKKKKKNRERLLLSTFYSMMKLCCLNRQQALSFFCSMFHTPLRSINTTSFLKLTEVKKTAHVMSKYTQFFPMPLPQGIYNILCFAKVYIIQSISHLVFHFLKKEKERTNTTE